MNNINKEFEKIKASNELKERTYQRIKNKPKRSNYILKGAISLSVALASILIVFLVYNQNNVPSKDLNMHVMLNETYKAREDMIFYNEHIYTTDGTGIGKDMLDKELGTLNKVDTDLTKDFDSYYHDGASLYSIKDDDSKLAVLDSGTILVFVMQDR